MAPGLGGGGLGAPRVLGSGTVLLLIPAVTVVLKLLNFYWCWSDYECCNNFRWTAGGLSHRYACIHSPPNPHRGFRGGSFGKEGTCNTGDAGSIPGSGRSPGEGNGNPVQYSCLENAMDRGAWWAAVQGVTRVRHDLAPKPPPFSPKLPSLLYMRGWWPHTLQCSGIKPRDVMRNQVIFLVYTVSWC